MSDEEPQEERLQDEVDFCYIREKGDIERKLGRLEGASPGASLHHLDNRSRLTSL